ncbi:MAG: hypothetical protein H9W81_12555 [Enterococcus sp.]|nr:hypothetical protein [Enterococcus sp.]
MISMAYGIILEKADKDIVLTKLLRTLPPLEQKFLYKDIYSDDYRHFPLEGKLALESLDLNSPDFLTHALINLHNREALLFYVTDKFSRLNVRNFGTDISAIFVEKTVKDILPYSYMEFEDVSAEEEYELQNLIEEFGLDLTPKWLVL